MAGGPKELNPLVVFSALAAAAGTALCVVSAMSESQRLLGTGTLCLMAGALGFLIWAVSSAGELRRRVCERTSARPRLEDAEFAARFFAGGAVSPETVARVRRAIAGKFEALGGAGFWPEDLLVDDLHLDELAPADLADLPAALRREFGFPPEAWPEDAEAGWRRVEDIYATVCLATAGGGPHLCRKLPELIIPESGRTAE
jgi:hypothetical protein